MQQSRKISEQFAFNTRPKREEHMLFVMHESTHEERLSQALQTNKINLKSLFFSKLVVMEFSMLQTKITNSISSKQLLMKMVSSKLLYHQVFMN